MFSFSISLCNVLNFNLWYCSVVRNVSVDKFRDFNLAVPVFQAAKRQTYPNQSTYFIQTVILFHNSWYYTTSNELITFLLTTHLGYNNNIFTQYSLKIYKFKAFLKILIFSFSGSFFLNVSLEIQASILNAMPDKTPYIDSEVGYY